MSILTGKSPRRKMCDPLYFTEKLFLWQFILVTNVPNIQWSCVLQQTSHFTEPRIGVQLVHQMSISTGSNKANYNVCHEVKKKEGKTTPIPKMSEAHLEILTNNSFLAESWIQKLGYFTWNNHRNLSPGLIYDTEIRQSHLCPHFLQVVLKSH